MHHLLFLSIAAIWGSSFMLMKVATQSFGALTVSGFRLASGAIALGLVLLFAYRHVGSWRPSLQQTAWLLLVVVMTYAWPYSLQPWLVHQHGGGFIGMMVAFVPLITILAQIPILGQRASLRQCIGVAGGLLMLGLILADGRIRDIPVAHLALAVTVPTGYAIGNTIVRRQFGQVPTIALTAWCLLIATILVVPLAAIIDPRPAADAPVAASMLAIVVLGTLGTAGAISGLYFLIQRRGPLWAGMVTYLIPLGAVLWAWIDNETVSMLQLGALFGVLVMVGLVQYPSQAQQPVTTDHHPNKLS